jgi:16S rRNA G966 N2-methylase RsmD
MSKQMEGQDSLLATQNREAKEPVECLGHTFESDEARRSYFLAELKKKLADQEFRDVEGFPIGSDDDILALSDPPYYTACPNPFLSDLLAESFPSGSPNLDEYKKEPFAADVREGKQDPVCMAHTYHTKVPYRAIARYILHYTKPGDIVLDAFAGTGMTALASSLCAKPDPDFKRSVETESQAAERPTPLWGERRTVLFELSPFATFLARNFNSLLDVTTFRSEAKALISQSALKYGWLYKSELKPGHLGEISFVVWVDVFRCECGAEIKFWDPPTPSRLPPRIEAMLTCASCLRKNSKRTIQQARTALFDSVLNTTITQNRQDVCFLEVRQGDSVVRRKPSAYDLALLRKIESELLPNRFPAVPMMFKGNTWGDMYRSGYHFGITHTHHFWTKRNLIVLSDLFDRARRSRFSPEMIFLCTSFAVKTGSRMHNIGLDDGALNLAGQIYNTLQIPSVCAERNLYELARGKVRDLTAVFSLPKGPRPLISTCSAGSLYGVPDEAIDYVFVDPPFGENIMYSELSFLYEAWLGVFTKRAPEAIISDAQGKDIAAYKELMARCFAELYRVLKPGRWMTLAFHNSKNAVWNIIQETLGEARFVVADVRVLDKGQATYKQMTTTGAVKQDLVISAYKPNGGLERRFELEKGTEEGVWDFVRTHLRQLPVPAAKGTDLEALAERQAFLLFDRMLAFHVQRGSSIPLSAGEFYAGLALRFPERDGMYFLPDQVADYERKRMTVREVKQLEIFVRDEVTAIQWLRQRLLDKPQSFQDLHPQFLREISGWSKHEQALELKDLLDQNFLCYGGDGDVPSQIHGYLSSNFHDLRNLPKGDPALKKKAQDRWYVPDANKAADLEKLRERSLLREFEEYRQSKVRKLRVFRLECIRAGFKRAWQQNEYQAILEVSAKIPEDVLQDDPMLLMWYTNSQMRAGRSS